MENVVKNQESGVKKRFEECLKAVGLKQYDSQIINCGITKGKLQSMWENATGDVPGIILETVCRIKPEINAEYICRGVGKPLRDDSTDNIYLELLQKLLKNDQQAEIIRSQRDELYAKIAELVK